MLVLSRKVGEQIQIGTDIILTVTSVKGNRVTLGIEAPKHIRVDRGELQAKRASELAILTQVDLMPATTHGMTVSAR
jgi:carbon storage regulator